MRLKAYMLAVFFVAHFVKAQNLSEHETDNYITTTDTGQYTRTPYVFPYSASANEISPTTEGTGNQLTTGYEAISDPWHTSSELTTEYERVSKPWSTSSEVSSKWDDVEVTTTQVPTTADSGCIKDLSAALKNIAFVSTPTTTTVSWNYVQSKQQLCLSDFTIEWTNKIDTYDEVVNITVNSVTLPDLLPCTDYEVRFIPNNSTTPQISNQFRTKTLVPEWIIINDELMEDQTVNISLDIPPEATYCMNQSYISIEPDVNIKRINNYKYEANLTYCQTYNITASIDVKYDSDRPASTNSTNVRLYKDPDPIDALRVYFEGNLTCVTWEESNKTDCIAGYFVKWDQKERITENMFYNIPFLDACTEYNISVQTISETGIYGPPVEIQITTPKTAPGAVENLEWELDGNSLKISWNPPSISGSCVTYYSIKISDQDGDLLENNTTETSIMFSDLIPCANLSITVWAHTDTEQSPPATSSFMIPGVAPNPPVFSNVTAYTDRAEMWWKLEPYEKNKCMYYLAIIICSAEPEYNNLNMSWIIPNSNSSVDLSHLNKPEGFPVNMTNLSPFTNYTCSGFTTNNAGQSDYGNDTLIETQQGVPGAPYISEPDDVFNQSFRIRWNTPDMLPCILEKYEIIIRVQTVLHYIPPDCPNDEGSFTKEVSPDVLEYTYVGLADTMYSVNVRGRSVTGWGDESETVLVTTQESEPSEPRSLDISMNILPTEEYDVKITTSWLLPCSLNGQLSNFSAILRGERNSFGIHAQNVTVPVNNDITHVNYTYSFGSLKPEYSYRLEIAAINSRFEGRAATYEFVSPSGIPQRVTSGYERVQPNPFKTSDPTSMALMDLPVDLFNNTVGDIIYYAIIVGEKGYEEESTWYHFNNSWNTTFQWPFVGYWEKTGDIVTPYQATPEYWNPFSLSYLNAENTSVITYILGNETCSENTYCNGPLRKDTDYSVKIRGFTNAGFRDSEMMYFHTDVEVNLGLVLGLTIGILAAAFFLVALLYLKKGKLKWTKGQRLTQISPVPQAVSIKKFITLHREMLETPGKLRNEFQLLASLSIDLSMPTHAALLPTNKKKNRYTNILPFDATRVLLQGTEDESSDYINASFIKGYTNEIEYIATQGPTEGTCADFWKMVLQQDVSIIAMVSQFYEQGKEKCHKYFPTVHENMDVTEDITVRCANELNFVTYTIRTLVVQKDLAQKKVTHLQFNNWPDFGCPTTTDLMLQFCQMVRQYHSLKPGLIIVHCSAGVGRTGTLIAIDILLQHIHENRKVDVFGTVYNLRKQRINMVQTEKQYAFIYNCVKDAIQNPAVLQKGKLQATSSMEPIYENVEIIQSKYKPKHSISESVM